MSEHPEIFEDVIAQWERFERMTIPSGAADLQREEMKKAFIAGYLSALVPMRSALEAVNHREVKRQLDEHYDEVRLLALSFPGPEDE